MKEAPTPDMAVRETLERMPQAAEPPARRGLDLAARLSEDARA